MAAGDPNTGTTPAAGDVRAPSVTAVVVNWNGREFLGDCLRALLAQDGATVAPIVIDNGSTDGSQELVRREFPQVELVQHERNNYAAANDLGVARARGEYALLLNTDATLRPGCLRTLVQALDADPRAGAAGPKVVFPDGRLATTGIAQREDLYWFDRGEGEADDGGEGPPEEVLGVSGCCALFRVAAWRAAGGQDETFHMYYEDVDLALALRHAGFRSLYVPAAVCVHVGHGSIVKVPTGKDVLGERNRLFVIARWFRERLGRELVRSPWFQSAPPEEVRAALPALARRAAAAAGAGDMDGSGDVGENGKGGDLATLFLALRDEVRAYAGELDARWGEHRNLPKILAERERWIATLLEEVARLRLWRLPGRRLKPDEAAFLARVRGPRGKK